MKEILEYIISEAKNKRLSKRDAISFIRKLQNKKIAPELVSSNISAKPSSISLGCRKEGLFILKEPAQSRKQSITLSSKDVFQKQSTIKSNLKDEKNNKRSVLLKTLEEELTTSVADILFMDKSDVEINKNFIDMGMDSIISVEWIKVLNKRYKTSMTASKLYDYPSIREFSKFFITELNGQKAQQINDTSKIVKAATQAEPTSKSHLMGKLSKNKPLVSNSEQARLQSNPKRQQTMDKTLNQKKRVLRYDYYGESSNRKESIAIVGMSGRYSGADNLDQYWDILVHAKSSVREVPATRWDMDKYFDPNRSKSGKIYCKWMGCLNDIEVFDPLFFDISPKEAEIMDPQHRIFMQEGYKAFEDAGLIRPLLSNKKSGAYIGIMNNEYGWMLYRNRPERINTTGNSFAVAAARLPYFLNLKGSALSIDTACSSSLVATHLACQALLSKEIDIALVGGVSLYLTPESYISMCASGMLSSDGRCKAFDNGADGFVPGEGVGALVLKRLRDAEADNDLIYGVIIGSGTNQNGKTNGITAPNRKSQTELIRDIYSKYNIDPESITYSEMHGTGTRLGDLIELEALSTVFREKTNKKEFCGIGSVKPNIGHTSAASGIASLQKVLLSMKFKKLVPTLNYTRPNENFNFDDSPFFVNTKLLPWNNALHAPKRACVSSFGFSGTNAHIVLEEYLPGSVPARTPALINAENPLLFVLSAKSQEQLNVYVKIIKNWIESHQEIELVDIAYSLQSSREAMDYRLAILAEDRPNLIKRLAGYINKKSHAGVMTARASSRKVNYADEAALTELFQKKEFKKLAQLWVKGLNLDWRLLYGDNKPRRCRLPTYPFAKERYWISADKTDVGRLNNRKSILQTEIKNNYEIVPEVYAYDEPYLKDHTVFDERVLIGVTHGSLALNTFFKYFPQENAVQLRGLNFVKPIVIKEDQLIEVQVEPVQKGSFIDFKVRYRDASSATWDLTATGKLQKANFESKQIDLEIIKDSLEEYRQIDHIYSSNPAVELGDSFKTITHLYTGKDHVLARVALRETSLKENHEYELHPLILNSAFQVVVPLLDEVIDVGFLPFGIKAIYFYKCERLDHCWLSVGLKKNSGEMIVFDADVINDQSQLVAQLKGCSMKRLRSKRKISIKDHIPDRFRTPEPLNEETESSFINLHSTNSLSIQIQKYLADKIKSVSRKPLKLSNFEANLMDLGLESSQLVAVAKEIEAELKLELFPTLFFEYPNIKELTEFFLQTHEEAFVRLIGGASKPSDNSDQLNIFFPHNKVDNLKDGHANVRTVSSSEGNNAIEPVRDDIAVIGMHGLFPEAPNLTQFWDNLCDKKVGIKEIPIDHWDYRPWYDQNPKAKDKTYCKWGGFIEGVDQFDAEFFNISPREAEWMDPQLRLLLQSIYISGEDAGYINQLRGTNTGVFVGVCCHDYADKIAELNLPVDPYVGSGNSQTVIANRVSFLFDLQGPSLAVDTACSSSLFALHYACQAMRNKECDLAFVGGVNLLLSSWHYRYFSSIGALSPTGRCLPFDAATDGYVPGECIASILLKPLKQAKKDGDHIYAIVKGSAALHGGYTPSFTAPSVAGEENVVVKAWKDAGVEPETISYIEAHGTGTQLGDPIEISSLKKAFKRFTNKKQFCVLGSVKANIGHTEGAAGIAGILKVILQMKHRQFAALPRFKKLNPYIQLDQSALYINQDLEEWKSPEGNPRRAGISAFGMSGAYAHIVLEEYINRQQRHVPITITPQDPAIIILSARNKDRLKAQVQQLLVSLEDHQFTDKDLADIAYTLQVGREAMEERLAILVGSIKELAEKLENYMQGQKDIPECFLGQAKSHADSLSVFAADEDMSEIIATWISKRKYTKLMDLWVKGFKFDWNTLYDESKPRRISLPSYPFAKEHFWITATGTHSIDSPTVASIEDTYIHPLLHQNTSDFAEQRFSSTFSGDEFFLSDHNVKGRRVLPGVAYLEMAREAVEQACGALVESDTEVHLKNVVWNQPIVQDERPVQVHIKLHPKDSGEIAYQIYSCTGENGAKTVLHNQGIGTMGAPESGQTFDLHALQAKCGLRSLNAIQCYEAFKAMEIDYGPAHQGIEKVFVGQGQVLAKLSLPSSISGTLDQFVLHPCIMDSALQAFIGLMLVSGDSIASEKPSSLKPVLPFALEELEVLGHCRHVMWALINTNNGNSAGAKVPKLKISLCDEQGRVLVRMKGLTSRALEGDIQTGKNPKKVLSQAPGEKPVKAVTFTPAWDSISVEKGPNFPSLKDRVVIVGGTDVVGKTIQQIYPKAHPLEIKSYDSIDEIAEKLQAHGFIDHIIWMAPHKPLASLTDDRLIEEQNQGVLLVFRMIKALLGLGHGTRELGWTLVTIQAQPVLKEELVNPTHAGLHGLIGSMAKEYPNWKIRLIDLDADGNLPDDVIFTLPTDPKGNAWAYRGKEWYRQQLLPLQPPQISRAIYKKDGVYVVIGGAGGIGEAWSEYMLRTYQAQIIWIGRREKDESIRTKLDRLAALGPAPHYIAADATEQKALQQAFEEIKARYTKINGVIHSAIVLSDKSLMNMEEESFKAGLSAKVDVSVRIAQVFKNEPLDFVVFFSSIQVFTKSPGQSNYASGCTFKDAFARQLSQKWPCKVKVMNWGYWGSIGIVASKAYQERMAQMGIGSIEPPEAMEALETLLAGPLDQMALIKTTSSMTALEGINAGEVIAVYPENVTPSIQSIRGRILAPGSNVQRIKSKIEPHIKEMDHFLSRLLWGQLRSMGIFTEKNTATIDLKNKTGLRDLYNRWFDETLAVLIVNNYITLDGETCSVIDTTPVDMDALLKEWDLKKGVWLENPGMKARVALVEATLRALPQILTGEVLATDIMFPDSSLELVEGIYKNNLVVDYFNEILAGTLAGYLEERLKQDSAAQVRILEIGAGTGGTSAAVFQKLLPYQKHIQEYCYTDISKAFLLHAQKAYGLQNPYLTYQIFNVERPIGPQNIRAGGYDVVIAANVLHATINIRQTLRNAKAVLSKNGLLLLNEISAKSLFAHLTFGLLDGWWLYEDTALRLSGCPGLSTKNWQAVLENEGFRSVFFPTKPAHEMGQQIIVAESDGIVRQIQPYQPDKTHLSQKIETKVPQKQTKKEKVPAKAERVTTELLRSKSTAYIKKLVGETLKIPVHKIDSSKPLEKYGIDSILVVQLTNHLSKLIDNVTSTLFFEYQTIDAVVDHLIKTRKDSLPALVKAEDQKVNAQKLLSNNVSFFKPQPKRSKLSFEKSKRFFPHHQSESKGQERQTAGIQDIAIIGLSGRYPGAKDIHEFWNILRNGKDCITAIPKERWDHDLYFDEDKGKPGKTYCRWGGFIEGVDQFDPLFFNISPREAEIMDPMCRLFLETVWNLLEDAGYTREALEHHYQSKIGVYVGAMFHQYHSFDSDVTKASAISVSSYGSIANRVSHYFNFKGPSVAIDTMCSSATLAIHMACESLIKKDCQIAIAGGVNLSIHPKKYLGLSQAQLLGSHINCRSFGDGDGYLPAESVGAVLLKPLLKAIRDRDSILAVIKSTATNHGGHTTGFTVPDPNAQAQLMVDNFKKAGIHPRSISYVEAAANGSALADAIEVAGIKKAFQQFTSDQHFCAIGSVKSNIGHPEAASGIAQLTKVILQLQHQQLVPSINADPLNPNINFDDTPFYLQREPKKWMRPVSKIDGLKPDCPRRATISSFGAGGSNAHLIVEEYIPFREEPINIPSIHSPQIVVFSAKSAKQLQAVIKQMLDFIEHQKEFSLPNLAYTLQVGREEMVIRAAMVVKNRTELQKGLLECQKLIKDANQTETIVPIFIGNLEEEHTGLKELLSGQVGETVIQALFAQNNLEKIAQHWVQGGKVPWESLHIEKDMRRISLPTYPFARERYWVSKIENPSAISAKTCAIHPLLHQNTSDIFEQRFSSTFTGREFFLIDHIVQGQKVLPGVACLEMARAAVEKAVKPLKKSGTVIRLKNIVWVHPLVVLHQAIQVHIGLFVEESGEINYEIYSETEEDNTKRIVHSQGTAVLCKAEEINALNIKDLKTQCTQANLNSSRCYEAFRAVGLNLGKGFQGVERIYVGTGQALGKLSLPSTVLDTQDKFVLHPSMIDSSLHVSLGLMMGSDNSSRVGGTELFKLSIPFTLKEIDVLSKCTSQMWSLVRYAEGGKAGDNVQKFDIDLCDGQGNVCVRMKEFAAKVLEDEVDLKASYKADSAALQPIKATETSDILTENENGGLLDNVQADLVKAVSSILNIRFEEINTKIQMSQYGFDSISFIEFAKNLNQKYKLELNPTVFFEYPTIQSFAKYLVKAYGAVFEARFAMQAKAEIPMQKREDAAEEISSIKGPRSRFTRRMTLNAAKPDPPVPEPIAVVGMSGRFPMAKDVDEFWKNLLDGKDCITKIPKDRWDWEAYYGDPVTQTNKTNIKWGGFIDGVDEFDPQFFGISPREAELMDPQQRLLMTYVWKAVEDAGISAQSLSGTKTGIFIGTGDTGYGGLISKAKVAIEAYSSIGNMPSMGPNRMSYFLNIHGPSEPIETACSSSLVAIHRAVNAIESGSCKTAIVGGINTILTPEFHLSFSKAGMLSEDGRCKSFSDKADGYVRGEGVGILVLKRLKVAEEDGDHIYGIIKGVAENHGGRSNSLTAPNLKAQAELLQAAYTKAGIDPRSVSYIETHGTGTKLGDPIEIDGLKAAFKELYQATGDAGVKGAHCGLGSVKSNIGHLELAAGIAGVIKVLLQLKYKILVKSLHCDAVNPYIQLSDSPFYIVQEKKEWKALKDERNTAIPRRAGVSSFGVGGVNAHIVMEEYIAQKKKEDPITISPHSPVIIVLSAKSQEGLQRQARQLFAAIHRQQFSDSNLQDMAYTLQTGRKAMEERLGLFVGSIKELAEKLKRFTEGQANIENLFRGQVKRNKEDLALFAADEDMADIFDIWIAKRKYHQILALWVKGLNFDWNKIYGENRPQRISLPTYPFAKERYWVPTTDTESGGNSAKTLGIKSFRHPLRHENTSKISELQHEDRPTQRTTSFLKKQWEQCIADSTGKLHRTIAVLTTKETKALAAKLVQHLPKAEILEIYDLESKYRRSQPEWKNPEWKNYGGWIDLTGCGREKYASLDWLAWLQQLIEQGHQEDLMLLGVTKGLESYQNTTVNLSGASCAGLYRMLQSEYHYLRSRHMDVEPSIDDDTLAQQIAAEFLIDSEDAEISYRDGRRYRSVLAEVKEFDGSQSILEFPEEHVLWITGGTRGLGYLCAEHFVRRHGIKRLVLTGREILPPRDQWDSYKENSSIVQKIEAVKALERQGAQVKVISLWLTDQDAVRQSLKEIKTHMGSTGGIIHCAGMSDRENPAFIRKSIAGIEQILEPKITGLDILYQTFRDEPLKFFVLFSSVSAIIPTLASGQCDYAMANAYMDYFAEANRRSCPFISIQWPNWKETGMGEVKSNAYRQTGLLGHTNIEGLRFLDQIIAQKLGPVILPAVVNKDLWQPAKLMQRTIPKAELATCQIGHPAAKGTTKTDTALLNATLTWLISLFSRELKLDPEKLEIDIPFQDYGMDSILLAQVITKMDQKLKNISVEPSVIIEYPTLKSLAAYLTEIYPEAMTSLLPIKNANKKNSKPFVDNQSVISLALKQEKKRGLIESDTCSQSEKIAVVGMACHFPDAMNIKEYWNNLKLGKDSIREVPKSRWYWKKYYDADQNKKGKSTSKWGAFIEGIEQFDPGYFKIPESLAPQIDPLQRQWLEVSSEALADAGYNKNDLWGKQVGVFAGARAGNFVSKLKKKNKAWITGVGQNFIAVQLAHVYNFKGPNMVVDAACASALTAVHLAVKSLKSKEAEIALAGGVDILLDEQVFIWLSAEEILSPDGRCKTFDANANGIGLGEGCGVLVLKPLKKAIQDNNKIYGVIDGSAINSDGNTMGVTTPNPEAQQELIKTALTEANISPETISYIETHGTGTLIGDPIELRALTRVFTEYTEKKQFCGVGSVKSNIGHLLSAASIAGMMKGLLSITQHEIPPTLHCVTPNPRFNFEASPFYPVRKLKKWTNENHILRAGISAFGLGGNNAHLIVSNEGIPNTHKASLEPRGKKMTFNRKRYWPEKSPNDSRKNNLNQEDYIFPDYDDADEFEEFFNIEEV